MGISCLPIKLSSDSKERNMLLPVDTPFQLPSPLPSWPLDGGFAQGTIDLGGLEVRQVSTFTKVWSVNQGGQDDAGATFFKPSPIPDGFYMLGCYAQRNSLPLFGWVLVGKNSGDRNSLAKPIDYTLIWSSESSNIKPDVHSYFWLPVPPEGYKAVGIIISTSPEKPSVDDIRCVHSEFTDDCETDDGNGPIWSAGDFWVTGVRPVTRGTDSIGVRIGTFIAQANGTPSSSKLSCLKNHEYFNYCCMPNVSQIQALMNVYSPWIYFHPDEEYLVSSVSWFFDNGALLYDKANQNSKKIISDGSNLPQNGSNDGAYWIDLPTDDKQREFIKKGDLSSSKVYLHIKPILGGIFTDIVIWTFYPFNGPARAKVKFFSIKLGRIGEHVGDWEHITLRISNFNGELWRVYFGQHSSGEWIDASQLEYQGGNKPVAYSSLNGHAMYSKPGLVLQGNTNAGIGIRNDTAKGSSIDTGERFEIVSAEYLSSASKGTTIAEPAWLNYTREWGPKISYKAADELKKFVKFLPGKWSSELEKIVEGLPDEVLGEEGPTGPKMKGNWNSDEK